MYIHIFVHIYIYIYTYITLSRLGVRVVWKRFIWACASFIVETYAPCAKPVFCGFCYATRAVPFECMDIYIYIFIFMYTYVYIYIYI